MSAHPTADPPAARSARSALASGALPVGPAKPFPAAAAVWSPAPPTARQRALRRHRWNMALWTLQGWLSMFYLGAAWTKLTEPVDLLAILMRWPASVPIEIVRGAGALEAAFVVLSLAPLVSWSFGRGPLLAGTSGLLAIALIFSAYHLLHADLGAGIINLCLAAIAVAILRGRARSLD